MLEEIKSAVSALPIDKAPDPDGFPMRFYQEYWEILKDDLLSFFSEFHLNGKIPKGINSTFWTLPKKIGASFVHDFRPISLISGPYKILAKVFFPASRGLRQGDLLSPFLFTLVADAFSQSLKNGENGNLIQGFRIGKESIPISHFQYADDTLLL